MYGRPDPMVSRRIRILLVVVAVWAGAILLRLVDLQIFRHRTLRTAAKEQHTRRRPIPALRGTILDRNGQELAVSLPAFSVCVNPVRIRDLELTADTLSALLGVNRKNLLDNLYLSRSKGFLWVKRRISDEEFHRVMQFQWGEKYKRGGPLPRGVPGIDWIEMRRESRRYYPKGQLAAHVLGGIDGDEAGNGGIELSLNDELEGIPGLERIYHDSRGNQYDSEVEVAPLPGRNVWLTIDERVQHLTEQALQEGIAAAGCRTGSAVVMDPHSGDVLAMASYPSFHPEVPPGADLSERVNLAITSPFEPGSVFKVFTLLAALELTDLRRESSFFCGLGKMTLFGRVIHDHVKHGWLSMEQILARSSNVGAIQVALNVREERLYEFVRSLEFGRTTGIGLPAESPGHLRPLRKWQKSSIGSVAMGHELSTTTLQLARACSVVASGGKLVQPRIVAKLQRPGEPAELRPAAPPKQVVSGRSCVTMRTMMESVVLAGTGTRAQLATHTSGGKTGSAQIYNYAEKKYTHRYNSSFLGFAPVQNPAIVVVVTLNGSSELGGIVAAPVFKKIAEGALQVLEVPKDLPLEEEVGRRRRQGLPARSGPVPVDLSDPDGATQPAPVADEEEEDAGAEESRADVAAVTVRDVRGKTRREVVQESLALGLPVNVVGDGIARSQIAPAGAVLKPGNVVRVDFAR